MLKINHKPVFTRDVTVKVPSGDSYVEETVKATFRALDDKEVDKFELGTRAGSTAFLKAVIERIDGVVGDDSAAIVYTEALRDDLLDKQWVRASLARGYFDGVSGYIAGN